MAPEVSTSSVRTRFWVEAAVAFAVGFLAVLTLFWRDWIEAISGFDPDQHSGSAEWAIVAGLAALCLVAASVARIEWRRPRPAVA